MCCGNRLISMLGTVSLTPYDDLWGRLIGGVAQPRLQLQAQMCDVMKVVL